MPHRHPILGHVEEMIEQILMPDLYVIGGEAAQAHRETVHVQHHHLRPGIERHVQRQSALGFGRVPHHAAGLGLAHVFLRRVLGRRLRRRAFDRRDDVGALGAAGAHEGLGAAVGDVGLGGRAQGFGFADLGGEGGHVEAGELWWARGRGGFGEFWRRRQAIRGGGKVTGAPLRCLLALTCCPQGWCCVLLSVEADLLSQGAEAGCAEGSVRHGLVMRPLAEQ